MTVNPLQRSCEKCMLSMSSKLDCVLNFSENVSSCEMEKHASLPDAVYVVLAIYLFFITIFGILVNGAIIYLYFSRKEIATISNMYVVALCVCGFLIAIFGVPFAAASSIRHEWLFGEGLCKVHGFLFTGLGIVMIAILTGIAIDKYIFIVRYQFHHKVTKNVALMIIAGCYVYGVIWGLLPLFGWNHYVLEPVKLTCSVEWTGDVVNQSYAITIMFTGLLIPVSIIAYLYSSILRRVSEIPFFWFNTLSVLIMNYMHTNSIVFARCGISLC